MALVHDLIEAQGERKLKRLKKQLTSQNLLTHHVHILEMNGESYGFKHSRKNRQ